jgi:hypothetical protein
MSNLKPSDFNSMAWGAFFILAHSVSGSIRKRLKAFRPFSIKLMAVFHVDRKPPKGRRKVLPENGVSVLPKTQDNQAV